jgi:hypothetical protein
MGNKIKLHGHIPLQYRNPEKHRAQIKHRSSKASAQTATPARWKCRQELI